VNRITIAGVVVVCVLLAFVAPVLGAEAEDALFSFAILSDRTGGHTNGVYPKVIEAINAQEPDLVVTVGDHIEGYGEDYERAHAEWDSVLAMLRMIEAPVYVTPGNHDIWDDESEVIYTEKTGREPYYSFDHDDTHFVVLDNSRLSSWADIGIEQAQWLTRDLAGNDAPKTFVFFHKPLWDQTLRRGLEDNMHTLLAGARITAVFCGHYHTYFHGNYSGIDYTTIGSSGGAIDTESPQPALRGNFFQFAMVDVTQDGYELTIYDVDTGKTYPQDFVTVELLDEIDRIETELVDVGPFTIAERNASPVEIAVSIENVTDRTLEGEATWDVPEQWSVRPVSQSYNVPPSATRKMGYSAVRSGGIYPVPSVSLGYPLADGRELEVRKSAKIVRTVSVPRVSSAMAVDGKVDEPMRDGATSVQELYQGYGYEPVEGETEFLFAHSGKSLFVTAVCEDVAMDELAAATAERDGAVYLDDCVGFFLQPDLDEAVVYQIYVNPEGVVFDQMITFDETMWYTVHPEWDGAYKIATSRDGDEWIAEMEIPFATLAPVVGSSGGEASAVAPEGGPGTKRVWGVNFRRKQQRTSGAVDWQVPIDYDPGTFGAMVLE